MMSMKARRTTSSTAGTTTKSIQGPLDRTSSNTYRLNPNAGAESGGHLAVLLLLFVLGCLVVTAVSAYTIYTVVIDRTGGGTKTAAASAAAAATITVAPELIQAAQAEVERLKNEKSEIDAIKAEAAADAAAGAAPKQLLRGNNDENKEEEPREVLLLKLSIGKTIEIVLRPDLSPESTTYIRMMVEMGCKRCEFYRAEKPGIFQGIIANRDKIKPVEQKGRCPEDYRDLKNNCPPHDVNCACHGPVMHQGMVGWAGGGTGPDFFIDHYKQPAHHWGTQHTLWGQVVDPASFEVIDSIWNLPTTKRGGGGMTFLEEPISFEMQLTSKRITDRVKVLEK